MKMVSKVLNLVHQLKCRIEEEQLLKFYNIGFGSSEQTFVDQSEEVGWGVLLEMWNPDISSNSTPAQPKQQQQHICSGKGNFFLNLKLEV